jgi:hypothetical protein
MELLKDMIAGRDVAGIKAFMAEHDLVVSGGRIVARDDTSKAKMKALSGFWNQRQQARKILLNSLYGALLNEGLRFFDERIGQSVTLTGRSIVRHMNAKTNEVITGVYDHTGDAIVYADTDSIAPESQIRTNRGTMRVEELFDLCRIKWAVEDKEYAVDERLTVVSGTENGADEVFRPIKYVYRHKTKKRRFRVTTAGGKSVVVTEDHSVMVRRGAELVETKPTALRHGDEVLVINTPTHGIGVYSGGNSDGA